MFAVDWGLHTACFKLLRFISFTQIELNLKEKHLHEQ